MTLHTRSGPSWHMLQADYRKTCAHVAEQGGADLFAFSPPYCDARTYGAAVSWGDADYASLGDAVFAALKPGGHALVNVDAPVREWRKGMGTERGFHPWRLMLDWAERVGFRVPDRLAFGRNGVPGDFWGFRNDWEPLLWFQRPGDDGFAPNHAAVAFDVDPWKTNPKGSRGRRPHGGTGKDEGVNTVRDGSTRRRGTFWYYGSVGMEGGPDLAGANHPARWPYKLAEDLIRCFCPPDGLVCDPFTGAGTTAAAAIAHGRRFIGGDMFARQDDGKPWIDVAADILIERQRQGLLFGAR